MKQTFTHLEITRLAYNEAPKNVLPLANETLAQREYRLLKNMQQKVDSCLAEPSAKSINAILNALKSL